MKSKIFSVCFIFLLALPLFSYAMTMDELDTMNSVLWSWGNDDDNGELKKGSDKPRYPWRVIRRNPVVDGLREIFADSAKGPSVSQAFNAGQTWVCKEYDALLISAGDRGWNNITMQFRKFGHILENISMDRRAPHYVLNRGELAGADMTPGGTLEAIRVSDDGDLLVETSMEVNTFFKTILSEIWDTILGRDREKAKKYFEKEMTVSIAGISFDPEYYMDIKVLSYTFCPKTEAR